MPPRWGWGIVAGRRYYKDDIPDGTGIREFGTFEKWCEAVFEDYGNRSATTKDFDKADEEVGDAVSYSRQSLLKI